MTDLVWADAATPDEGAVQASDLFRDAFGYEPRGVWSAPGRVKYHRRARGLQRWPVRSDCFAAPRVRGAVASRGSDDSPDFSTDPRCDRRPRLST